MTRPDFPLERYQGAVPTPVAVYRPGNARGVPALLVPFLAAMFSTVSHTPLPFGGPLTSAAMEAPLGQLDAAIQTVIATGSGASTSLTAQANSGQASLTVASSAGFAPGDPIYIGTGATFESRIVNTVPGGGVTITVTVNLTNTYAIGKPVSKSPVELVAARGGYTTLAGRLGGLARGVNVKDPPYNAVGDGVANDSAAIQAAIDAVSAAGGGSVYCPAGNYKCNVVLKIGVTLRGEGHVQSYTGTNVTRFVQAGAGHVIDTPVTQIFGAAVLGISVVGGGSGVAGRGINFRWAQWCQISKCLVDNTADEGIAIGSASIACTVEDVLIQNAVLNRTRAAVIGALDVDGADHFISRVEATPSLAALNHANLYICGIVLRGANHFISNSVGEFADCGFRDASSGYCRFTGCRADLNFGPGFYVGGAALYSACLALNNSQSTTNTYSGFYLPATVQSCVFSACAAWSTVAKVHKYGLEDLGIFAALNARNAVAGFSSVGHGTGAMTVITPTTDANDRLVFYPFTIVNVTGTGTKAMQPSDASLAMATPRITMLWPGSVVGVYLRADTGRSAGTLIAKVNIDAVQQGLPVATLDGTNTFAHSATLAKGTVTFTPAQSIGIDLVGAAFTPTTNIIAAGVWVLHHDQ